MTDQIFGRLGAIEATVDAQGRQLERFYTEIHQDRKEFKEEITKEREIARKEREKKDKFMRKLVIFLALAAFGGSAGMSFASQFLGVDIPTAEAKVDDDE